MQASISGFFGDLSSALPFVFCELRCVLLPEFGDLILGVGGQKPPAGQEKPGYERLKIAERGFSKWADEEYPTVWS
jgi:hypothetical protein